MGSPSGLSPGSPNKYLGPNVYLGTVVQRNREPTGADYRQPETGKLYPYATLWVVGKDPTTGTQGDIWILGKIASNVADWLQIGSGGVGPLLTVTADTGTAVPDGFGNMNFFGQNVAGSGIATSASGSTVSHQMDSPFSLSNFAFSRSVSGSRNQLAVTNGSDTAGSDAVMLIQQGGPSGGDCFLSWQFTGSNSWSAGMDKSVSASLVFCPSGTLTGTNVLVLAPGGNVSVPLGDFKVSRSSSGSVVVSEVANDSNTAGSDAVLLASVAGTSSGDPYTRYNVNGAGVWAAGIDNSDSDAYVISASAAPGSSNVLRSTTTGNISVPMGDFLVSRSAVGSPVISTVQNLDNTNAASDAILQAGSGGASGGDAYLQVGVSGAGAWCTGVRNSDGDAYYISSGGSLSAGTNYVRLITTGGQYRGNNTNTAPPAGFIGEQISSYLIPGSAVSLADGVATNVTSISLTAGIWDVSGVLAFDGTLTGTRSSATVTSTSATVGDAGDNRVDIPLVAQLGVDLMLTVPSVRFTLASTTTIYLVGLCAYTVGTCIAYGRISGTRVG